MINIQVSSLNVILLCSVLVVFAVYYFKYMIFYYENKDKLNDVIMDNMQLKVKDVINTHEKKNNQKMSYREFRIHQYFNSPMMKKVNEISRELEEKKRKEYDDYLKEGIKE